MSKLYSCLLGLSVGDALGLPYERMPLKKLNKVFKRPYKHKFLLGKFGMFSDDTEHSYLVIKALSNSNNDIKQFEKNLKREFIFWFLTLPFGAGAATIKSCLKLLLGFSGGKSGVYSAGNGPAMRSAVIGVYFQNNIDELKKFIRASTIISHTDDKAYYGSLIVALTAIYKYDDVINFDDYFNYIKSNIDEKELLNLLKDTIFSVESNESLTDFCLRIGSKKGISGYMYHTIPCVLHVWLRQLSYKESIIEIISAGGDTDTSSSILGGIISARLGVDCIPNEWITSIQDYPLNVRYLKYISNSLGKGENIKNSFLFYILRFVRNVFFLLLVYYHLIKRIFI